MSFSHLGPLAMRMGLALLSMAPLSVAAQEICANALDDDADGLTDLADPDCPGPEDSALRCADDLDNECEDPATGAPCAAPVAPDCEDPSCEAHCP